MNVNPIVREELPFIDDECHGQEVAIVECFGCLENVVGHRRIKLLNQLADGHRADEVCTFDRLWFSINYHLHCINSAIAPENLLHACVESDLTAIALDDLLNSFPHHPWPKLWIIKCIDQRLDYVALRLFLNERILNCGKERQALDPLRGPFGHDLITRNAPNFFSISLEEDAVETFAKTV